MLTGTYATFAAETMTSKLYATFGSLPGGANAKLGVYSWTDVTDNNLVQLYTFSVGELDNYTTLKFTLGDKENADGMIRVGYKVKNSNDFVEFGSGFGSNGEKTVDLDDIDKTEVSEISFGGRSGTGEVTVYNVYLTNDNGDKLYPTYGTVGGSATFCDYKWTNTTNNLWPCFEVSAGVLDDYSKLYFTLSNAANGSGPVRMVYRVNGGSDTEFGSGWYTLSGTKTVDISAIDNITKISFGGKGVSGNPTTGSVNLRDVYVSNTFDAEGTTPWTWSQEVANNTVSYDRTFTVGQTATICLPFALTADEVTAAGAFYEFTGVNGSTLNFTKVSTTEAYTPYVFIPAVATPFANLTGKTIVSSVSKDCKVPNGSYTFQGTLVHKSVEAGDYGYSGGQFKKAGSSVTINAFRAYFVDESGNLGNSLDINLVDNETGVEEIAGQQAANFTGGVAYNMAGMRVGKDYKGIVIVNGKKIMQ